MAIAFNGNGTHANGILAIDGNSGEARVAAELFMDRLPVGMFNQGQARPTFYQLDS